MSFIEWNDEFSVSVSKIDSQHKRLIDIINQLHEALENKKGREIQNKMINEMIVYASVHFQTEEKLMEEYNYPLYNDHRLEHDQFTEKAVDLKNRIGKQDFLISFETLIFLKKWWQNHILGTDKKYSTFFNQKGLK